jgi:hypothetical protein
VTASLLRAVAFLLGGGVLLAPLVFSSFRTPGVTDSLPISLVGIVLLLVLFWQTVLAFAQVVMLRLTYQLEGDHLTLLRRGEVFMRLPLEAIKADEAAEVVYRQGKPERIGKTVLRPRRRFQRAIFLPVSREVTPDDPLASLGLRAVARMYAGRRARYGLLITPDHAGYATLLTALGLPEEDIPR